MAATALCLSSRTFLNDFPADIRLAWNAFLDRNPAIEDMIEQVHLPVVESVLGQFSHSKGDPLFESQVVREGKLGTILSLLGGAGAAYATGALTSTGPNQSTYRTIGNGFGEVKSVFGGLVDQVEGRVQGMMDNNGVSADSALRGIVKNVAGAAKGMGIEGGVIGTVMKMFGANVKTIGGVLSILFILYMLLQVGKSQGPEAAEKAADVLTTPEAKNNVVKLTQQAVPQASAPLTQADKVLDIQPKDEPKAPAQPTGAELLNNGREPATETRRKVYGRAERYLRETYCMGFRELRGHLIETHGRREGDRRFHIVSRIALSRVLAG